MTRHTYSHRPSWKRLLVDERLQRRGGVTLAAVLAEHVASGHSAQQIAHHLTRVLDTDVEGFVSMADVRLWVRDLTPTPKETDR